MTKQIPITIARGDGIGPEIMDATLKVLGASGAQLKIHEIEVGEKLYNSGFSSGIKPEAWEVLRQTKVLLKSPITTPQGGGMKSLNVTMRKALGLYANVRPCTSLHPFVRTKHPKLDLIIIRENEEDLYAGIEYRQTDEVYQTLKLISRPGSEKICRYAFEYAKANKRKKVTCFSKDNIMKFTDGLFHQVFDEVAKEYPEIENEHYIVDIGAARLADTPEIFDVIVMANLYGDILSDVAAQIAGSVGLAGSSNIGEHCAMFEAIHGSAPLIAGQGIANPSGLLFAASMMLVHIGQPKIGEKIQNAILKTIEDGIHTADIFDATVSKKKVSTSDFTQAVIERLGAKPTLLAAASLSDSGMDLEKVTQLAKPSTEKKSLVGIDIFFHFKDREPALLAEKLKVCATANLTLLLISNRGIQVWPSGSPEIFCTDHWRCRFLATQEILSAELLELLSKINSAGLDFIKTENLYLFDGKRGYSLSQGQ